ncbi:hypothetical protein [Nevskia soli]|uniref:hypothetical protein n=1 Tax=Nevskia soli TaxID=418856 RepID=UPI0004A6ABD5|nr:hypothetical protein [Nevskia soli]
MKQILPCLLLLASLAPFASQADACAAAPRCYDAGPFTAEVTSLSPSWNNTHNQHFLRLNLRLRNTGDRPLILGFPWGSSPSITDNYGNAYRIDGNSTSNIIGIGIVRREGADTSFVLAPGASRSASLIFNRWIAKSGSGAAVGNQFTADVSVEQLRVLPGSGRVEVGGQYSLNFQGLSGGAFGNLGSASGVGTDDVVQGVGALIDAFSNKKKH